MIKITFEEVKDYHHEILTFRSKVRAATITLKHLDKHLVHAEKKLRALAFQQTLKQEE